MHNGWSLSVATYNPVAWNILSPGRVKIGTRPCRNSREGSAPCSNEARAHATILGLLAWYSLNKAPACPCRGHGPLGTGNRIRDVHSPISAQAKQKSTEYCVQVATNGERAKPDWIQRCISCRVRSWLERVLCKKPVNSPRNACSTVSVAVASSESNSVSGKRLQRRVQSAQSKNGGCEELKITTNPALSSECGSATRRTPCPCLSASTLCCV